MALLKTFFGNARFVSFQYRTGYNARIKQLCRLEPCLPEHRNFFTDKCMRDRQSDVTPPLPTSNKKALDKDAKTEEPPRTWFAPGEQDFERIKLVGTFVDRSLLLEKLLGRYANDGTMPYEPVLITAPRRFGKSANLSMVKHFLEIELDDGEPIADLTKPVTKTPNFKLFEDMKIMKHTKIVDDCFGRHPVIHLDFKGADIFNREKLVSHCRQVLYNAIIQHAYLVEKKILNNQEKQFMKSWCVEDYDKIGEHIIKRSLLILAQCLYKYFGRKVFILVDEYDAIATEAIGRMHDKEEVKAANKFFVNMLSPAIKGDTAGKYVQGALLTGISYISSIGLSTELNNVLTFRFLHNHEFTEFYGVIESEVERIARWYEKTHKQKKVRETLKEWYNGYVTLDGKRTIYSLWSVGRALEAGELANYWTNTGSFSYLPCMLKFPQNLRYILDLLNDKDVTIELEENIEFDAVMILNEISKSPGRRIPDVNLLFSMMLDEGYLSIVKPEEKTQVVRRGMLEKRMKVKVKLPNKEIKSVIRRCVQDHFRYAWGFHELKIQKCAQFFENVKSFRITKDDGLKLELEKFRANLLQLLEGFSDEPVVKLNESHLHCLMYYVCSVARFKRATQYSSVGGTSILDLLMLSDDDFAIIIELKYRKGKRKTNSSRAGLKQILDPSKNYLSVLTKHNAEKYFLLSISVNKRRQPSLSCLLNEQIIDNALRL